MLKKISKVLGMALLVTALLVSLVVPVSAEVDTTATAGSYVVDTDSWENWPQAPALLGVTGCLMDVNTGAILYAKGMDVQRFPASITKIMTALIVVEGADLNAQVAFTETGLADAYGGSSNINPQPGEIFTMDEMLQMLLVKSANDVATQIAECMSGSVEAFAERMNQRAAELGCTNTHFANANGLENDNHYTTAHDMALIMNAAIKYDRIREIMASPSIMIPETNLSGARYYDTHLLMISPESEYFYDGARGGKTGYTPISGCTLVMYATRNDRTLIGVVMGGGDSNLICTDMADLFNYGFDSFSTYDMTDGYPYIAGGSVLLPKDMDKTLVNIIPSDTPDGVLLSYQYNGQNLGNGLLAKETYDTWQKALHPEEVKKEESETAEKESVTAVSEETSVDGAKAQPEKKKNGRTIGMYIAIGVLAVSILCCIILIVLTSEGYQNRARKQRRNRKE